MPRHPKPWFREGRGWYIQRNGKQVFLGKEKPKALSAYHREMGQPVAKAVVRSESLVGLIDSFLGWVQANRAPDTYRWYLDRLQLFCRQYPDLRIHDLKPLHVQKWIDGMKVASGTKRNYARSIMRCMRWAEEQGYIEKSPIAHFKKPRGGVRQTVVSPEEFQKILGAIKRQPMKDLCSFAWETGARALECLALEARHVELSNARVVFPVEEEKMERTARVIYLTDKALEIVKRLSKEYPEGKLFRNTDGIPWTTDAVNCCFIRLKKKLGTKYCLTAIRHSFCHRLLKAGVDALTVSNLMGHSGVSMVVEVYSHMNHAPEYLRESLKRV